MDYIENYLKSLKVEDLLYTLQNIMDDDYTLKDFIQTKRQKDLLYILKLYDLVFISNDERVLLTRKGNSVLEYLNRVLI